MPKEYPRSQRVGDQLQRELAELIQREVKDPRVSMVSVTAVRVSRDLANARIYITTLNDEQHDAAVDALNHAAGFLRRSLGSRLRMRSVPALKFYYDETIEHGMHINSLINEGLAKGVADEPSNEDDSNSGEND